MLSTKNQQKPKRPHVTLDKRRCNHDEGHLRRPVPRDVPGRSGPHARRDDPAVRRQQRQRGHPVHGRHRRLVVAGPHGRHRQLRVQPGHRVHEDACDPGHRGLRLDQRRRAVGDGQLRRGPLQRRDVDAEGRSGHYYAPPHLPSYRHGQHDGQPQHHHRQRHDVRRRYPGRDRAPLRALAADGAEGRHHHHVDGGDRALTRDYGRPHRHVRRGLARAELLHHEHDLRHHQGSTAGPRVGHDRGGCGHLGPPCARRRLHPRP